MEIEGEEIKSGGGRIEVSRDEDDKIVLSFMNEDGTFRWYRFDTAGARRLAAKLEAVAIRAVDLA